MACIYGKLYVGTTKDRVVVMGDHTKLKLFLAGLGAVMLYMAWVVSGLGDDISTYMLMVAGGGLFVVSQIPSS